MTVRELIEALGQYDPDMRVVARGYEAGWDDVNPREAQAIIDGNWRDGKRIVGCFGRHGDVNPWADEPTGTSVVAL